MHLTTNVLEQLFVSHYRALCLYALHYVDDIDVAEDVVMDCYTRYAEMCGEGIRIGTPKSYLYRMVYHSCIDVQRASVRVVSDTLLEGELDDGDQWQERSEREARLWIEIDKLPPTCRQVLLMSKRDGMPQKEIASELGISVKTVEAHLAKAYQRLRKKAHDIYVFFFAV